MLLARQRELEDIMADHGMTSAAAQPFGQSRRAREKTKVDEPGYAMSSPSYY
jgi:hypothetical protein